MNERCLHVLYRHVNLRFNLCDLRKMDYSGYSPLSRRVLKVQLNRQHQFVRTMLDHPDYGKHVRYFKGKLCPPSFDDWYNGMISEEELWRGLQLLTHVQSVDVISDENYGSGLIVPTKQFPNGLFQSATSVSLVGYMPYGLAKSILNAINPATLKHLCLGFVQEMKILERRDTNMPGERDEDGRILALGATSGLLTELTGQCIALRTLILRRIGQSQDGQHRMWHTAAEEASYLEWASFIRSVQGTLKNFMFEQAGKTISQGLDDSNFTDEARPNRIMDERFRRLLLPAIVSGTWPCLAVMKLRGARGSNGQKATLITELKAVLGGNVKIVVEEMVLGASAVNHW